MKTLTWHNDPALKAKAVAGYKAHIAADTLIKGKYFSEDDGVFKGCHIACVITDLGGKKSGSHSAEYERVTGLPEWLASLSEYFFENIPNPQNQQITLDILKSVAVGKDIGLVENRFLIWLLTDETHGTIKYCDEAGRKATLDAVALHQRVIDGDIPSKEEWAAAWDAARVAARAAAWNADGDTAWNAARVAARAAAMDADWDAARDAQSAKLIQLLKSA